ncbi:hypothetical protein K466DRAFT_493042, partial [Polyporus arcularius HHB13444]
MDVDQDEESTPAPSDSEPEPDPDPEVGYTEDQGVPPQARRKHVRDADAFIAALRTASLDKSGLDAETLQRLRDPPRIPRAISAHERAGIRMYTARGDASEANFADHRAAFLELHPDDPLPSYEAVKRLVAEITGVTAVRTEMCENTCVAYTGPFENFRECPKCKKPRYDALELARGREVPRRTFLSFPIGPQLQAM